MVSDNPAALLAFTIDPRTARIVKIEGLDPDGARHELSERDKAQLIKGHSERERTIEQVVERAFEAGIACVLDDEPEHGDDDDSFENAELTHRLLSPLIEHSAAAPLLSRTVLDHAILGTLIQHAMASASDRQQGIEADTR